MTAHTPARRGWRVMTHAVERLVERVAPIHHDEAAAWLADHAHEAVRLGVRSRRGDPLYRLCHPFHGPDAVLVVKTDPGGIRAVVTCGWWDEDDPDDTPDDAPLATPPATGRSPDASTQGDAMTAPPLCPTCCHDYGHRLRSSAGPYLWRPGLVRSAVYLAHEASWAAWQRAITATYDINHDLADEIRRYLRDHPPQAPAEADWLMDCPTCHGTGRDPSPDGGKVTP